MPHVQPTRLVLLGDPVAHSLSPQFQKAALRSAGLPVPYEAHRVAAEDLERWVAGLRRGGAAGNVTVPHKEHFAQLCDRLTDVARRVGAVNTFWCEGTTLVGDNTDVHGVRAAVGHLLGTDFGHGRTCGLIGGGGSAAAVVVALLARGVSRIQVWARTRSRAEGLRDRFGEAVVLAPTVTDALHDSDLVVNATPIGLHDDAMPVAVEQLPESCAVLDLVYRPGQTAWVNAALARGHRASDGLYMLVEQGAAAFERWFDIAPDRQAMWQALGERR